VIMTSMPSHFQIKHQSDETIDPTWFLFLHQTLDFWLFEDRNNGGRYLYKGII
jgi:hypothetical protein